LVWLAGEVPTEVRTGSSPAGSRWVDSHVMCLCPSTDPRPGHGTWDMNMGACVYTNRTHTHTHSPPSPPFPLLRPSTVNNVHSRSMHRRPPPLCAYCIPHTHAQLPSVHLFSESGALACVCGWSAGAQIGARLYQALPSLSLSVSLVSLRARARFASASLRAMRLFAFRVRALRWFACR
jgi:hypothetical protein